MTAKYPKIKNKGISLKKRDNSGWLHAIQYKKVQILYKKKIKSIFQYSKYTGSLSSLLLSQPDLFIPESLFHSCFYVVRVVFF